MKATRMLTFFMFISNTEIYMIAVFDSCFAKHDRTKISRIQKRTGEHRALTLKTETAVWKRLDDGTTRERERESDERWLQCGSAGGLSGGLWTGGAVKRRPSASSSASASRRHMLSEAGVRRVGVVRRSTTVAPSPARSDSPLSLPRRSASQLTHDRRHQRPSRCPQRRAHRWPHGVRSGAHSDSNTRRTCRLK